MRLRYYFRGLGIGIVVTALILALLPREKEVLTDEEIRIRALQLGMIDNSSITLADMHEAKETEEASQESSQEEKQETEEASQESSQEEKQETEEASQESSHEEKETEEATKESSVEAVKSKRIVIQKGVGSYTVSQILCEADLVIDAKKFDDYLCDNGYSRSIRAGEYDIPVNATEEEIARIISGK